VLFACTSTRSTLADLAYKKKIYLGSQSFKSYRLRHSREEYDGSPSSDCGLAWIIHCPSGMLLRYIGLYLEPTRAQLPGSVGLDLSKILPNGRKRMHHGLWNGFHDSTIQFLALNKETYVYVM
jgi:hypothetical protein